jgi:hypothetical protein
VKEIRIHPLAMCKRPQFDLWLRWNHGLYVVLPTLLILNSLVSFNAAGRGEQLRLDYMRAYAAVLGFSENIVRTGNMQDRLLRL